MYKQEGENLWALPIYEAFLQPIIKSSWNFEFIGIITNLQKGIRGSENLNDVQFHTANKWKSQESL